MKRFHTIGDLLKSYREHESKSQSDFASEIDVDVRSIIRWEKNETLIKSEKEDDIAEATFIPLQVIRNLNTPLPIPIFYDFDLRKYSLNNISTELPDAQWILSKSNIVTKRIRPINNNKDIENIIRHTKLQKNPLKTCNAELIRESAELLPELNIIIEDQSGNYSGHCVYFPLAIETYNKLKDRSLIETELHHEHLVNYKNQDIPVFYCHSITADCNENFFYIIGAVLKFYKETPLNDYIYALLTSRYDSHHMSEELGVEIVWEDNDIKEKYGLLSAPRLVEGNFKSFLKV